MADFEEANVDAAAAMGIFAQHDKDMGYPDGYTAKLVQQAIDDAKTNGISVDDEHETGDAETIREWWVDDVEPPDKWQQLVKNYDDISSDGKMVNTPSFDSGKQYVPQPGSGFQPPGNIKTFSGDTGSGSVTFTADAIKFFVANIGTVAQSGSGVLLSARDALNNTPDLKPGLFARAELLRETIVGSGSDSGLLGDTTGVLQVIHSALYDVGQDMAKVLAKYKTTSDFSAMTADDFSTAVDKSTAEIDQIQNYGGSSSTGKSSGNSGSGSGSSSGSGSGSSSSGSGK